MKVTKHNAAIVRTLLKVEGSYMTAHQIAVANDTQAANLKTALAALERSHILVGTETYPRLYTLNQPQALDFLKLVEASEGALARRVS